MTIHYLRLRGGDPFPKFDDISVYKAVVVIEDNVDSAWQAEASRWLADTGCRYMMAWGRECKTWDDSVDHANLEQFDYAEIPDDGFVMTTWHENEPLQEAIWFAKHSAHHPTLELQDLLFLHIGSAGRRSEFEKLYRDA